MMRRVALLVVGMLAWFGSAPLAWAGQTAPKLTYNRDVRPILSDKCFRCHGPDSVSRKANLRLDKKEIAFADRGGYRAIMQGKGSDVTLEPKDVLFIPDSASKKAGVKAAQLALSAATGLAWRF